MKKTKQQLIEDFFLTEIKVGDILDVKGLSYNGEKVFTVKVEKIQGELLIVSKEREIFEVAKNQIVKRSTYHIGANPFKQDRSNLRFVAYTLESILLSIGVDKKAKAFKTEKFGNIEVPEINWNPTITDKNGNKVPYQRGFVWTLIDKQLLIESIYQNLDIGKIILKKNSYEYVEEQVRLGNHVGFKDIIDGKQRLNALSEFFLDKFEDLHGNLYSDLSKFAQNKFGNFMSIAYGEMDENSTDEEIQETFLKINFTGVQMSQQHIDYVKSLEIKK